MENLLSTIVFILPGFMMYFWIQMMGVNPVIKHSVPEFGAMAALAWVPVVASTLSIMSLYQDPVITIKALYKASGRLSFLLQFMAISVGTSFILSFLYIKFLYPVQRYCVNIARRWTGSANLSDTSTVWEKFFIKVNKEKNKGNLPVKIYKMDKPEDTCMVGLISNASRPFETERAIVLQRISELSASHKDHNYEVIQTYVDLKSGIVVAELDLSKPMNKHKITDSEA